MLTDWKPQMQNDIGRSVALYNQLKTALLLTGELSEDDQALLDTLEGETDIKEQIAELIRDARRAAAMAKGLAEIMKDHATRKSRLEHRSERNRGIAFAAMQNCGLPRVEAPDLTISISPGVPSVIIADEAAVPDSLCKIERTPMKSEIAKLLKSGEFVPYASLSNGAPVLKVSAR
jgi:Siphovirus Gp157